MSGCLWPNHNRLDLHSFGKWRKTRGEKIQIGLLSSTHSSEMKCKKKAEGLLIYSLPQNCFVCLFSLCVCVCLCIVLIDENQWELRWKETNWRKVNLSISFPGDSHGYYRNEHIHVIHFFWSACVFGLCVWYARLWTQCTVANRVFSFFFAYLLAWLTVNGKHQWAKKGNTSNIHLLIQSPYNCHYAFLCLLPWYNGSTSKSKFYS